MLISASARCQVALPGRLAMPYSVTMFGAWVRGVVMMSPPVKCGMMFECSSPLLAASAASRA